MPSYRNISFATAASLADLLEAGANVTVRGKSTREFVSRLTELERPLERYLFLPQRHHDVFALFAETMWVLAGRNDIDWLVGYLHRAPEFSDDQKTWHGGYGPRLRRWAGNVDQLDQVRRLLSEDRETRRATMVIFDPAQDFVESKDIPCNNWLSWIARDGRLHLNIAVRSNDVMWGFSGINAFEWSVLQEILGFWLGLESGVATYFASSFHLYDYHFDRARRIGQTFHGLTPYDFGVGQAVFRTSWNDFPSKLDRWFELESQIRSNPNVALFQHGRTGDPLLDSGLALVHVFWAHKVWGTERLTRELATLPDEDYVAAVYEHLRRAYPAIMNGIPQPNIARFFEACRSRNADLPCTFKSALKRFHAAKDRAYAGAWKRRGELISILPNIARKADRLEAIITTGAKISGETKLDTAIDLLIYVEKYRLFLAQGLGDGALVKPEAPQPLSDHEVNFDELIDEIDLEAGVQRFEETVREIMDRFEVCSRLAQDNAPISERLRFAGLLADSAERLVARVVADDPAAAALFSTAGLAA